MVLELRGNPNYAAMIHQYSKANEVVLPNRDRVVGYQALGHQSIVGKDSFHDGEMVLIFGAETQLSEDYAWINNLHRHEDLNEDPTQKGYLDDNRRIRAIRLGGNRSDALIMPVNSIEFAASELNPLDPGAAFDHVDGVEICRKYQLPVKGNSASMSNRQGQKKVRVSTESFPEHFDTMNLFRDDPFAPVDYVTVTQKLHGTSVRMARVPVARDLTWLERLAQKVGVRVQAHEHGVVVGSRRVTKSINGKVEDGKRHFYGATDIWTEATKGMHELIPEDFVVFAEIIGWTPEGDPIQSGYTYNVPKGHQAVYVYRVAMVNGQGDLVDLPWRAVERFCEARGWSVTPALTQGLWMDVERDIDDFMDARFADGSLSYDTAVPLSDPYAVDEGVCIRKDDGFQPTVRKAKSPIFLGHETKILDQGTADVESIEAVAA